MGDWKTLKVRKATMKRIIETRGKLEGHNGKRRSFEDVINELINFFNKKDEK